MQSAKQVTECLAKGGNLADLPPPPPAENPDYVTCPHCNRRFNEAAAEKHIPRCANTVNRPKAPPKAAAKAAPKNLAPPPKQGKPRTPRPAGPQGSAATPEPAPGASSPPPGPPAPAPGGQKQQKKHAFCTECGHKFDDMVSNFCQECGTRRE